jgi:hypothetical protein
VDRDRLPAARPALEVAVAGTSVAAWLTYRWWRTGLTPAGVLRAAAPAAAHRHRWPKACKRAGLDGVPRLRKVASDGQDVTAIIHAAQVGVTRKELARGLEALADLTYARQITAKQRGHTGKYDLTFQLRGHPRPARPARARPRRNRRVHQARPDRRRRAIHCADPEQ